MSAVQELFDWIINPTCVRGSRLGDNGIWISGSAVPLAFDPVSRIVTLADSMKYVLRKETASKALKLHMAGEQFLSGLPLPN